MSKERIVEIRDLCEALLEVQSKLDHGFFIHEEGRLLYANEACSWITGYSPEELEALGSVFDLVVPEEKGVLGERMRRRQRGQQVEDHYESRIVHKSGRRVDVEIAAKPFKTDDHAGIAVLLRDITRRKRTEEALRESEKGFRELFEQSVDTLLVHDEDGRIVDCNPEACRSLGYSRGEMLLLSVRDFAANLASDEDIVRRL